MKNIEFGNFLYRLRKDNDLTQRFVAYQLNVSDKAVSKWENGSSKPSIENLKKLSNIFDVTLDELLSSREKISEEICKIKRVGKYIK